MKKLIILLTSAILCTCFLLLGGCSSSNNTSYYFCCTFLAEDKPIDNVQIFVNHTNTNKVSTQGKVKIENLKNGDVITYYIDGYDCSEQIIINQNKDVTINLKKLLPKEVEITSNFVDIVCSVNNLENDDFTISIVDNESYKFNGYYIDDVLVSNDINFVFSNSMRGKIFIKMDKMFNIDIKHFEDNSLIATLVIKENEKFILQKYLDKSKVFVGYYYDSELLSSKADFAFVADQNGSIYIKEESPKLNYICYNNCLIIDKNISFDVYVDDSKILQNSLLETINLNELVGKSGSYKITLKNDAYKISKSLDIVVENKQEIVSGNLVKYNEKYYALTSFNMDGYTVKAKVNNISVNGEFLSKNNIYYLDVTNYISSGENTLSLASVDFNSIVSKYNDVATYVLSEDFVLPSANITENILNVSICNDYIIYLVINGVLHSEITSNKTDVSSFASDNISLLFKDKYNNYYVSDLTFNNSENLAINSSNIINDSSIANIYFSGIYPIYLHLDNIVNLANIKLEINGIKVMDILGENKVDITPYLTNKITNKVKVTGENNGENITVEKDIFYDKSIVNKVAFDKGELTTFSGVDYYRITINGVLLKDKFSGSKIDLDKYIMKSGSYNILLQGYVGNVFCCSSEINVTYTKCFYISENYSLLDMGSYKILFIDGLNYKYFVNGVQITLQATKIDSVNNFYVMLENGRKLYFQL